VREDEFDYRWIRPGWFDQGRPCDVFVQHATAVLTGKTMPARWTVKTPEEFIEKFGAGVHWAKTTSYHMLLISGQPILRIWTNAKTKTLVEIADELLPVLNPTIAKTYFDIEEVPEGTKKKRGEFNWRFDLTIIEELTYLLTVVKAMYGVGNT
jgi:hypothetical protein